MFAVWTDADAFCQWFGPDGLPSAPLGARTMDQLDDLVAGVDVTVGGDVLDRIDEVVAPGTDVGRLNQAYQSPGLESAAGRRPVSGRRAAWSVSR